MIDEIFVWLKLIFAVLIVLLGGFLLIVIASLPIALGIVLGFWGLIFFGFI
jgi:hypothetical protein